MDYSAAVPAEIRIQRSPRDYLSILRKRKWVVLGVCLAVLAGTAVNLKMQAPMYDSTVSILIEPKDPNIMSSKVEEVNAPSDMAIDYYKTQYEILRSHKIMRETARRLKLNTHPEYRLVAAIQPESEAERALVKALRTHIKVSPVANSRIVNITVESIDPHLAADISNTLDSVY